MFYRLAGVILAHISSDRSTMHRKQRVGLVFGIVLAIVAGIAGPAAAASSPGYGTITGHVTAASGIPSSWSTEVVVFGATSGIEENEVYTGFGGLYELDNVRPGSHKLMFVTNGQRQWAHQKLTLQDADVVSVEADQTAVVDETLLPPGAIAVSATDATTGQPVGHVCAQAEGSTTAPEVCITDPGVIAIPDLGTGDYQLSVRSSDGLHRELQVDAVHVVLGQTTAVPVSLTPAGAISVTVTDSATGDPIGYACVTALRPGFNGPGPDYCPNLSDGNGKVVVGELSAGTYNLFVDPRDSIHGLQWVGWRGGTGDQSAAVPIHVVPGKSSTAPTVRLDPAGSITGTIVDADNQPISYGNATASVLPTGLPTTFSGTRNTDDQGRYTLDGLGPYRWPVQYSGPYGTQAWQWSGGTSNRYESHRVSVAAGQASTANFRMTAGGSLTGQILKPDGSAIIGPVEIWAYNAVTGDLAAPEGSSDGYGTFTINGLTTQDIKIQYTGGYYPDGFVGPAFDASPTIHVQLGATITYNIVVNQQG